MSLEPARASAVFLISPSATPCGVETFARHLARSWEGAGHHARQISLAGRTGELRDLWRALDHAEALVINAPVVSWKRLLFLPLLCVCMARLRGRKVVHVVHEWSDLDPRRRFVLSLYLLFATHVLYSSPCVRDQRRRNPIARSLPAKSVIVPIPPN